jgi:hypothetical protein
MIIGSYVGGSFIIGAKGVHGTSRETAGSSAYPPGIEESGRPKKLFREELNYLRENKPLSMRGWPDIARRALVDDPILFASGGEYKKQGGHGR